MNDDVYKFEGLQMSIESILDFNYEVTGPKSTAQTARESRNSASNLSDLTNGQ